jgi:hypothetical protein
MCQDVGVEVSLRRPNVQQSDAISWTHGSRPMGVDQGVPSAAKPAMTESELLELLYRHVEEKTGHSIAQGWHFLKIMRADPRRGTNWRIFHSGLDVRDGIAVDEAESELTEHYDLRPRPIDG